MRKNSAAITTSVRSCGIAANKVFTTSFRFGFLAITRSGLSARRIRRAFKKAYWFCPGPNHKYSKTSTTDTITTPPSRMFHELPQNPLKPSAMCLRMNSVRKIYVNMKFNPKSIRVCRWSGERSGSSKAMQSEETTMQSRMKLSNSFLSTSRCTLPTNPSQYTFSSGTGSQDSS